MIKSFYKRRQHSERMENKMKTVQVRNLTIGEGRPKVCVPIVGCKRDEIIEKAKQIASSKAELVEWRSDFFCNVDSNSEVSEILAELKNILKDKPVLFTFRTKQEGGKKEIDWDTYCELNLTAAENADLIDIEIFKKFDACTQLISMLHDIGAKVIASNHDFDGTPPKEEIKKRLIMMQESGADIAKIAVMPKEKQDVIHLLLATNEISSEDKKIPLITMSMGALGGISRISGELFGSAVTFASFQTASAPGQIEVEQLAQILDILHFKEETR